MTALKLAIGVAAFLALGFAGVHLGGGAERAAARLQAAGDKALEGAGAGWATLSLENGEAVLTGEPPDEEDAARALGALRAASGFGGGLSGLVAVVDRFDPPAPPAPAQHRWRALLTANTLEVTGIAPSERARAAAAREIADLFGAIDIRDRLVVASEGDDGPWITAAARALRALSLLDEGEISGRGLNLSLAGRSGDAAHAAGAVRTMETVPAPYRAESDIATSPAAMERSDLLATLIARETALDTCRLETEALLAAGPVEFASGAADVSRGTETLDRIADVLGGCGAVAVAVVGHTDSIGSPDANRRLSAERADAVADYLIARGVAEDALSARGAGSSEPVASNATAAGRARNRRIEIGIAHRSVEEAEE